MGNDMMTIATMRVVLVLLLVALTTAPQLSSAAAALPNIIFFLTDDLGWNSPSFHNPALQTPAIQELHDNGIELFSHYTYKFCAPTRSSFLTGRFPYKLAATRKNLNPATVMDGLHLSYATIANKLQSAGYSTHQFGKWHQGFFNSSYIPTSRGFNSSYGFLTGGQDHWTEKTITTSTGIDIWDSDKPAYGANGTWSGELYGLAAVNVIKEHAKRQKDTGASDTPLFLYIALHDTHGPTQAPNRLIRGYNSTVAGNLENVFYGMISGVDETVKNVTDALKETGLWDDSLVVWTTDNGSPTFGPLDDACLTIDGGPHESYCKCGSNHPLRGAKATNFEGGVRTPTVVAGSWVPKAMQGKRLDGLVHVCDWYATFCEIAGVDAADPGGVSPIDSISMVNYLTGQVAASPRDFIVHDHLMYSNATKPQGAIRKGDWKLFLENSVPHATWWGEFYPNSTTKPPSPDLECFHDAPCLFNITADMTEHNNVAAQFPEVVAELQALFKTLEKEYHPPQENPPEDAEGYQAYVDAHKGFLGPWK